MITNALIRPESIAVIGASNNIAKPGGKIYHNIRSGSFSGKLYAVNPKEETLQGDACYRNLEDLPQCDLAILAIPSKLCVEAVRFLAGKRSVKSFIIISAGFGEENEEGALIEKEITEICNQHGATLIGPNCIGVMTQAYQGVFTLPIPKLDPAGCDFISGSGATAVFIMEAGLQVGLKFNSVFSVGNSAQNGVEDVLEYLDENHDPDTSSRVKILYFESIKNPLKLLKHASSLINKGCRIAAIKAGTSDAGSRAASSHTGAMASSDLAVDALFRKAGITRCHGREELATVAAILLYPQLPGKNFAIITHAGGPAVMLTDALAKGGIDVPQLKDSNAEKLLEQLYPGSSAANPIDILATGTAEHVGLSLAYCENKFDLIDSVVLIFGTPGLAPVFDVYETLHQHMLSAKKPVYPVLPSVTTAADEVRTFLEHGHVNFPDEVVFGNAVVKIRATHKPAEIRQPVELRENQLLKKIASGGSTGYLPPADVSNLLSSAGIPIVKEIVSKDPDELLRGSQTLGFPLVMKVIGPVHKTDVGGVVLNINSDEEILSTFEKMRAIEGFQAALIQPVLSGRELFLGAKYEEGFGHLIMCGLGGIYVEALKDISTGLAPLNESEAEQMISDLKSFKLLTGLRGEAPVNIREYARIIVALSDLLMACPEINELDMNPLIANKNQVTVVDARIRI